VAEAAKIPWRVRWKGRLQRYAGLFSILGILIVLGTFIFRDVLRDRTKDLLGSLEAANATAMLKQSISIIEEKDAFIERNLESFRSQSTQKADSERRFEFSAATAALTLHNTQNKLAFIAILSAKLPSSFPPRKYYRRMQKDFEAKLKEIEDGYDGLSEDYVLANKAERTDKISSLDRQMTRLYERLKCLESDVKKERDNLTSDFEKETAHTTHQLRTYTYLTYVLYPAGLLIGILGGIAGAKVPGTGE
jgi:hypothetical protein